LNHLGFDFDIELPYSYLAAFKNYPGLNDDLILKIANNFVNDSFRTHVCLYYDPRVIALACLELSQMFIHSDLPTFNNKPWYHYLNDENDGIEKRDID